MDNLNARVTRKTRSWYVVESDTHKTVYVSAKTPEEALEEGKLIMITRGW